ERWKGGDVENGGVGGKATGSVPNYPPEYNYAKFAHVRIARLPIAGVQVRSLLDWISPGWDEALDWSLLLERESFFALALSSALLILCLILRFVLAWYADYRLRIPRFHLREHIVRAGVAFVRTPDIK